MSKDSHTSIEYGSAVHCDSEIMASRWLVVVDWDSVDNALEVIYLDRGMGCFFIH